MASEKVSQSSDEEKIIQYINLKLASQGYPVYGKKMEEELTKIAQLLLREHEEKKRLFSERLCPADRRIEKYLSDYFSDLAPKVEVRLPANSFTLDHAGLARVMSLAPDSDIFVSDIVCSYRIRQGVLHNPQNDRRTTQGVFHIAEGGFPIPDDKIAVPKRVFRNLLMEALNPPADILRLPFTSTQEEQAELFVSLLMRPLVCPEVPGMMPEKTTEIRFFAPGNLVSNLDFVEAIFGNAGDPYLVENDAALDTEHWTGHTGCIILAPHLIKLKKKDLGLPHISEATERQRRDGMCWEKEDELYNHGSAFKATCRDERGVMVTIIADNYFGYCKKEVKTQISYSANLFGLSEEEHSGGALTFASYDLGIEFSLHRAFARNKNTFGDLIPLYSDIMNIFPEGYGIDKKYPNIIYVPEDARFDLPDQSITWISNGEEQKIKLLAYHTYMLPSGYKIYTKKQTGGHSWHLIGTAPEGVLCHKPCTVSGGGKSEISKSIVDAMIQGPVFTADFHQDMDFVEKILKRDYGDRFRPEFSRNKPSRPVLSPERSLGSVIKLFTVSSEYTDEYNAWLRALPHHIKDILFAVKRFYRPEWGEDWRDHFGVDIVNGHPGHELRHAGQKLVANYLRVGREKDGAWRIYRVRQDFAAAEKLQFADDITVSIVIPKELIGDSAADLPYPSVKLITNCENYLFQRPDDAIYRGYDKQAEADLAAPGSFLTNYEPLEIDQARELVEDAIHFDLYTDPMKKLILDFVQAAKLAYVVSSAHPRVVDGKPSKNPRYLQQRPDHVDPRKKYLAEIGIRIFRKTPLDRPVCFPVHAVLPGRRNNPPDPKNGIPPLAVCNPIHYQELPELFMDFICSVTGKSPSTTGFGSEGALTKGPFNALWPIVDLNNAFVSFALTGYQGFSSAAGFIGPDFRVDHDISLLVPEIWCRMLLQEQDPQYLIRTGHLEKMKDFEYEGKKVQASILGYRITKRFVRTFLGRIFNTPDAVFTDEMLAPEKQDMRIFIDGIENIVATQKRIAGHYFNDGSIDAACPSLKALLHIMAFGAYEGKDLEDPEIRRLFTRDYVLQSDWYQKRLAAKQQIDVSLWARHVKYLEDFLSAENRGEEIERLGLQQRLRDAKRKLAQVKSASYLKSLRGTIGADPFIVLKPNFLPLSEIAAG